ncbi:ABC transporter permease [Paenibacillus tyrfis]|uniref:Peptide ABC transporter permease n=1 Tax=Paenibacillus tyrfis TaxID=1501230 RepID=A0A081P0P0_9BACL|nr:ABC transporter permease [Paenibacillus tyrfis]KEQ24263.1 peptide ABC transporter permease [Paenibacillus tyrfis]
MYVVRRIVTMAVTLWLIATLTFFLMHLIPGDPFAADSQMLPPDVLANLRAKYHLDQPIFQQYVLYLQNLIQLDLGPSIQSKSSSVNTLIARGIGPSALLGLQSMLIALTVGVALGIISALHHNKLLDYLSMFVAIIGISVPSFILAPLLIKYIAVNLHWLPVASWGTWQHSILPSIALSLAPLAIIARFVRASMLEVLGQNYMRLAEAKGLSDWTVVIKYGLRNALLPVLTFIGPLFASLITGTFVVEKIFAIPGLGKYFVDSIFNRDYPVIMGTTMFYSFVLVVTLFLIDLSYRVIDPRIKLTSKGE